MSYREEATKLKTSAKRARAASITILVVATLFVGFLVVFYATATRGASCI